VVGWAVDEAELEPASGVTLAVGRNEKVNAQYGISRPDVAWAYGVRAYVNSGFKALVPTASLRTGRYDLSLRIFDAKTRRYYLEKTGIVLSIL